MTGCRKLVETTRTPRRTKAAGEHPSVGRLLLPGFLPRSVPTAIPQAGDRRTRLEALETLTARLSGISLVRFCAIPVRSKKDSALNSPRASTWGRLLAEKALRQAISRRR